MGRHILGGLLLAICAVLLSPGTALADKPKPPKPIPLDERNRSKLSTALGIHCPDEFGAMTAAQRGRAVDAFKRFLKLAIGFYLEDDGNECNAELGAALKNFCEKNKKAWVEIDILPGSPAGLFRIARPAP